MEFGTLPFTLADTSTFNKRQKVDSLVHESLSSDIDAINQFEASTKNLFPRLLSLLADSGYGQHRQAGQPFGAQSENGCSDDKRFGASRYHSRG